MNIFGKYPKFDIIFFVEKSFIVISVQNQMHASENTEIIITLCVNVLSVKCKLRCEIIMTSFNYSRQSGRFIYHKNIYTKFH